MRFKQLLKTSLVLGIIIGNGVVTTSVSATDYTVEDIDDIEIIVTEVDGETIQDLSLSELNSRSLVVKEKVVYPDGRYLYSVYEDEEFLAYVDESMVEEWLGEDTLTEDTQTNSVINEEYVDGDTFLQMLVGYRHIALESGVLPSVMMGQAMLESGSTGSSGLAKSDKNLFGIKGEYNGQSSSYSTLEDASTGDYYQIQAGFRSYPTYQESIQDYVRLVSQTQRYSDVPNHQTPRAQVQAIKDAGYATDGYYVDKVMNMIETHNLTQFD